ncbi:amino acid adenylation domain-containing protein [Chitinophaga sp. Hz27]|uniref:amino acid adenylation domain-containing protein n=1 Tax=Chitinophaga sp. Hz27 TaxID=3347169 RepID=UPI0035D71587
MVFQEELNRCLKKFGNETAIRCGDTTTTYAQLQADASRITDFLLKKNPGKGAMVGIYLENKTALITTIIGVLNAGCVFVPLDCKLPQQRLDSMIEKMGLQYFISERINEKVKLTNTYLYDEMLATPETLGGLRYPVFDAADDIYVYFTSGSTGVPKGILGRNESLLQFIQWEIEEFDIREGTKVSQFISPYFDAFLRDIFVPLLAGGTICIPPADQTFNDAGAITKWLNDQDINLVHCVPSLFRLINHEGLTPGDYSHLQYVLLSGEKINPADLKPWYSTFGARIELVNFYGPSETTMIRTFYRIQPGDATQPRIPVGRPIPGTRILIAKKDLTPAEKLVPGELYIISDYSSNGYLNEPTLMQERFVTIHAGTKDEAKAFRTGDIARMLINGNIDLIGREDRQVKLRGARIELDEIENVLQGIDCLRQAVVLKHQDEHNNELLIAFLIRRADVAVEADIAQRCRNYLEARLPAYMIPADFREVQEFPLLSNGKINYKELLAQLPLHIIVVPENDIEQRLLEVWQNTLGIKEISTEDSFYKVGGNSLNTMKLIGRIHKEFNVRISLSELFNHLTIKKQGRIISKLHNDNQMVIEKAVENSHYPLSVVQENIYYNYQLYPSGTAFNLPVAWRLSAAFDKTKMGRALNALIQRHESLRSSFSFVNDQLVQHIANQVEIEIAEIHTTEVLLLQQIHAFVQPFDLSKPGLLRATIIHTDTNTAVLVVDTHHIVCDGISQVILFSDLMKFYNGEALEPLSIQYKDYATWEQQFRKTELYMSQREFWLSQFEGQIPVMVFPVTTRRTDVAEDAGGNIFFKIDTVIASSFARMIKEEEVTISSGIFAAYFVFLALLTGQEDIIVGVSTAGRLQHELEQVAGMFVKTLPVRYPLDTDLTFRAFMKSMHGHLVEVISRQQFDLSDIFSELNASRGTNVSELFKAVFVYQDYDSNTATESTLLAPVELGNAAAKYPVTLFASGHADTFTFRFEYQSSYFSAADAAVLVQRFTDLFHAIAQNPDISLLSLAGYNTLPDRMIKDKIILNL